jgi:hypothetical protein
MQRQREKALHLSGMKSCLPAPRQLSYLLTYLLAYLLTVWCSILFQKLIVTQLIKKSRFMEPDDSSVCSKSPPLDPILSQLNPVRSCQRISPCPRRFETFLNKLIFYGEGLLAPRPTPKLEDHPLSAVRDCLFDIFAATLTICRPSPHPQPEDAPCRGDKGPT